MPLTTAHLYVRVSSDEQAERGLSLDAQLAECRRYALRQDWVLGQEHVDILTGTRNDRPQYQALLAAVREQRKAGASLVVVVAALDRFGRLLMERVRSREELKALGVATHSVREGGEVSDLVANILAAVAQEETRRMGERVQATWALVRERGWAVNGGPPWGYRWRSATDTERREGAPARVLEVDEVAAPYAREMFARAASGESIRAVARWVQDLPEGVRQERKLTYARVRKLLYSPTYVARPRGEVEHILSLPIGRWPALVDDLTWQRVQHQREDHRRHPHQASGHFLLTGWIRCPECDGRLIGGASRPQYRRYLCSGHLVYPGRPCRWTVPASVVEEPVRYAVGEMLAQLREPAWQARWHRAWQRVQPKGDEDRARDLQLAQLRRDLARERQRLTTTALRLVDGHLDREAYDLIMARGHEVIPALETELERLAGDERTPAASWSLPEVLQGVGAWEHAEIPEERRILALLVEQVGVVRGPSWRTYDVSIVWTPLGASFARMSSGV